MVQIHSPRPFLFGTSNLQTDLLAADRLVSDHDGLRFKSNRSDYAISRSLIDLHCDSVMFSNRWKLSNLSNTCLH